METYKKSPMTMFKYLQTKLSNGEDEFQRKLNNFSVFEPQLEEDHKDIFGRLFQSKISETEEPNPVLKGFMDSFVETSQWKTLKETCEGNSIISKISSKKIFNEFYAVHQEMKKKNEENLSDEQKEEEMNKIKNKIRSKMRGVLQNVQETADKTEEIIQMIGYSPDGAKSDEKYLYKSLLQLNQNKNLRKIMEMAGRQMKKAVAVKRTVCKKSEEEIVGIEYGSDIHRLLDDEFMIYKKNRNLFLQSHSDDSLMQWEMNGKEPKGNGPIIVSIDESGSMTDLDFLPFAKALLFGIMKIAEEEKRRIIVTSFSNDVRTIEIKDKHDVMDVLNHNFNSGTNYTNMLAEITRVFEQNTDAKESDVILISDGESRIDEDVLKKFNEMKADRFKVISLMIGQCSYGTMEKFSDKIFQIKNPNNDLETEEFLNEIYSI